MTSESIAMLISIAQQAVALVGEHVSPMLEEGSVNLKTLEITETVLDSYKRALEEEKRERINGERTIARLRDMLTAAETTVAALKQEKPRSVPDDVMQTISTEEGI